MSASWRIFFAWWSVCWASVLKGKCSRDMLAVWMALSICFFVRKVRASLCAVFDASIARLAKTFF